MRAVTSLFMADSWLSERETQPTAVTEEQSVGIVAEQGTALGGKRC